MAIETRVVQVPWISPGNGTLGAVPKYLYASPAVAASLESTAGDMAIWTVAGDSADVDAIVSEGTQNGDLSVIS